MVSSLIKTKRQWQSNPQRLGDVTYDLHDEEIKKLTAARLVSNKRKGKFTDNRSNAINNVIKDLEGKVN